MAETLGSIQVVATINTKDYDANKKKIEQGNNDLEANARKTSAGFASAWTGAIAGATAAVVAKGMDKITSSIDGAIARVDTLNSFPRVLQAMGIGAEAATAATESLAKRLLVFCVLTSKSKSKVCKFLIISCCIVAVKEVNLVL